MYNPIEIEKNILKFWEDNKIFEKLVKKNKGNRKFRFIDGPITANNPMGVHHAWGRTYKDLWQRYKNMCGYKQRFQNGFDCQGLWVEVEVEKELGFKSSFNFVPERYPITHQVISKLIEEGFEVGVHGLKHDGKLFSSKRIFKERAIRINEYLKEWNAVGFTSPSMHRNLNWNHALNILYDISTFDTDPFEPRPQGIRTIFPFWIKNKENSNGYVESNED